MSDLDRTKLCLTSVVESPQYNKVDIIVLLGEKSIFNPLRSIDRMTWVATHEVMPLSMSSQQSLISVFAL